MKPVNLLPASDRRKVVSAKRVDRGGFLVIGALAVLLLLTVFYVTTQNKINGGKTDIAKAKQRTKEAEVRAAALGPFAKFAQVKETRVSSVKMLASQRFDWERLMREVALVLPEGTALQKMIGSTSGTPSAGGSTSAPAPATSGTADASAGAASSPSVNVLGCAKSQDDVATTMVRLRAMHRVDDVTLADSSKGADSGGGAPSGGSPDSGSGSECPPRFYKFDVTVTFKPAPSTSMPDGGAKKVPSRLGGGS
jgi:hypothetical protein